MPTYEYFCPSCGDESEKILPVSASDSVQLCQLCAGVLNKQISAPRVRGDYAGYQCPVTGDWIEGRKAHQENLKRHGCRVLETGEREEAARRRVEADKKLDEAVEAKAADLVMSMPERKFQTLAAEIEKGGDAMIERR